MPDNPESAAVKGQTPQDAKQDGAPSAPSPISNPAPTAAQSIANETEQAEIKDIDDRVKRAEKWMIWLTAAIAFFALCQVGVGWFQWRVLSGQLQEMKNGSADTHTLAEAAKKQADKAETISASIQQAVEAMRTSNDQAKTALNATISASHLDQRAWIGVTETDANIQLGKSITVTIHYKNTGRSPALNAHFVTETDCELRGIKPKISYTENNAVGSMVLLPGQEVTSGFQQSEAICSPENMRLLSNGEAILHVLGTVWYNDVFSGTKMHSTDFCFFADIKEKGFKPCFGFHNRAK